MNILELFGEPISYGGQESFVMNAIAQIDKGKYKIDLCTPYNCTNNLYSSTINEYGGRVYVFNLPFLPGGTRLNIYKPLLSLLKRQKYDVIHIHSGSTLFLTLASIIAHKARIRRIIVHSHSSGNKMTIKHKLIKGFARIVLSKCATDYCACSIEAGLWKFPKKIVNDRLIVINNAIDVERFKFDIGIRQKIRRDLGIDSNTYLLGHVGRFTDEKNQSFLIDVLAMASLQNHCKLLLIGEGPLYDNVLAKAKKMKMSDRVIHIDKTDAVNEYMQAMDCFLFPSKYEGLGMVAIEAQACGLPVIASIGVPKMIDVTGNVVFLDFDTKEWCNEIDHYRTCTREDQTEKLRAAGFDRSHATETLEKLYN